MTELFQFVILPNNGAVYTIDSTGESGDPCGTPTGWVRSSERMLLKRNLTLLSARNEEAHVTSSLANPMFFSLAVICA
jgi:hypothetical protein